MQHKKWFSALHSASLYATLLIAASLLTVGCERKEKVLDIETPAGEVEVERDNDGNVDVEINKK